MLGVGFPELLMIALACLLAHAIKHLTFLGKHRINLRADDDSPVKK